MSIHRTRSYLIYRLVLLCVLGMPICTTGMVQGLMDNSNVFPLLRYTDNMQNKVDWSDGYGLELLTSCLLIRVTRRGLRCIPSTWNRQIDVTQTNSKVTVWIENACSPSNVSLCVLRSNHTQISESYVLPTIDGLASVNEDKHPSMLPDEVAVQATSLDVLQPSIDRTGTMQITDTIRTRPCKRGYGRNILMDVGHRYDITACDIFESNTDLVYSPQTNTLYVHFLDHGLVEYAITSVLVLVLTVFVAEELSKEVVNNRSGNNTPSVSRMNIIIITWCALLICSITLQISSHRSHPIITLEDKTMLELLCAYIAVYTSFWLVSKSVVAPIEYDTLEHPRDQLDVLRTTTGHSRNHGINAMLATILFAVQVLVGSSENIYTQPFLFIFLYRFFYKVYAIMRSSQINHSSHETAYHPTHEPFVFTDRCVVAVDGVFIVYLCRYCFSPSYMHYSEGLARLSTFALAANVIALVIDKNDNKKIVQVATGKVVEHETPKNV